MPIHCRRPFQRSSARTRDPTGRNPRPDGRAVQRMALCAGSFARFGPNAKAALPPVNPNGWRVRVCKHLHNKDELIGQRICVALPHACREFAAERVRTLRWRLSPAILRSSVLRPSWTVVRRLCAMTSGCRRPVLRRCRRYGGRSPAMPWLLVTARCIHGGHPPCMRIENRR